MKTVRNRHGFSTLVGSLEVPIYHKVERQGFVPVNTLNEREQYLARGMHEKDVLQKTQKAGVDGYALYPQEPEQF